MSLNQKSLFDDVRPVSNSRSRAAFAASVRDFRWGTKLTAVGTTEAELEGRVFRVETFTNEFWTSRQRAANRLHEVSYRACFKPQLPRFFIERLVRPGQTVYDPFMGRGTTVIEAALLSRRPFGCDVNPLSAILVRPRLRPPQIDEVQHRLASIEWALDGDPPDDLLAFYHPETLRELCALRTYLLERGNAGTLDDVDAWIRMVAVNRLTGHSPGFFSVYTLPPNQAVTVAAQRKINERRALVPPRRSVPGLILLKSRSLLRDCDAATRQTLRQSGKDALTLTGNASATPEIESSSVDLVVTSPPFLDIVNYATDNWLRCWFCGIDAETVKLTMARKVDEWQITMSQVFTELARVLKPGGHVAFEVGEVRRGRVRLEEYVIPCGLRAGLKPLLVLINSQEFTKTAKCWGVDNNEKGTNTNRVVLFKKSIRRGRA
jgi:hypothetical protein